MATIKILDGNHAAAEAMRQINPEVVGAYPITPTSYIMESFTKMANDGIVDTEIVTTESEHAAMSVCVGACAAGGRVMTATASQGLALMHEVLFNASGLRLPIVLINGNRALGAPLSIHCDHSDSMAERDSGFLQMYAKDAQEVYDLVLQSFLIAEHDSVRTPIMICMDAFQVTHTHQSVQTEDDETVKAFIGEANIQNALLDIENPVSYGGATRPDYYQEARRSQLQGILNAPEVISDVGKAFGEIFGRDYSDFGETFQIEDAEHVFVVLGSAFGTIKLGVEKLRAEGKKVGIVRLRTFRPFPNAFVQEMLSGKKSVMVMERTSPAGGAGGPLFMELCSAMYEMENRPKMIPFIFGLGSKHFAPEHVEECFKTANAVLEGKKFISSAESFWVNVRE